MFFNVNWHIIVLLLFIIYITPAVFIALDFWAGIRKAKLAGIPIRSDKVQVTFQKIAKYYNALLAFTVIDAQYMLSFAYLNVDMSWHAPIFPFVSLLCSICIACNEAYSIVEDKDNKVKHTAEEAIMLAGTVASSISKVHNAVDVEKIAEAVVKAMHNNNPEK